MDKEECLREELGNDPRYGCRCQKCCEDSIDEAEYKQGDR